MTYLEEVSHFKWQRKLGAYGSKVTPRLADWQYAGN